MSQIVYTTFSGSKIWSTYVHYGVIYSTRYIILLFCNISGRNKIEVKATNVLRLCEEAVFCLNFLYGKLMQGGRKGEPGRGPGLPI